MCLPGARGRPVPGRLQHSHALPAFFKCGSGERCRPAQLPAYCLPGFACLVACLVAWLSASARHRLANGAEERGAVHEGDATDRRTAAGTGQGLAAIGLQGPVEVAALPIDVDVERVEGGPSLVE